MTQSASNGAFGGQIFERLPALLSINIFLNGTLNSHFSPFDTRKQLNYNTFPLRASGGVKIKI